MKRVTLYSDGSCSGNPGPGGWAAILIHGEHKRELSGGEKHTTNNRMELMGAIRGLEALKEPCRVTVHTDSAYMVRAFSEGWLKKWQKNGWMTAGKKPVENQDLWQRLLELATKHRVRWAKVKGHANDKLNNRCDELAVAARKAQS